METKKQRKNRKTGKIGVKERDRTRREGKGLEKKGRKERTVPFWNAVLEHVVSEKACFVPRH